MNNLNTINHPVVQHLLTTLRDKSASSQTFRSALGQLSLLLTYEATQDLHVKGTKVNTPLEDGTEGKIIDDEVVIIAILRAGSGMVDSVTQMMPSSRVGHVGIYRDRFVHSTVEYYFRVPDLRNKKVLVYDPLLATGDTAVATLSRLKEYGAQDLQFISVLVAPEGAKRMADEHPDVKIYCASMERGLDEKGYILPGLGDAGGRLYGQA